jgi:hypothetical protein
VVTPYREAASRPAVDSARRRTPAELIAAIEECAKRGAMVDLIAAALSAFLVAALVYFIWSSP